MDLVARDRSCAGLTVYRLQIAPRGTLWTSKSLECSHTKTEAPQGSNCGGKKKPLYCERSLTVCLRSWWSGPQCHKQIINWLAYLTTLLIVRFEVLTRRIAVDPSLKAVTQISIGQQSSINREDERGASIFRVKQTKTLHQLLGLEDGTATIFRQISTRHNISEDFNVPCFELLTNYQCIHKDFLHVTLYFQNLCANHGA